MFTTSPSRVALQESPGAGRASRIRGLSLVELVVFIAIVGVAVSGVLAALNLSAKASADPMTQKQALSIAEALLEEVQLQAFTYCDPDDPNAATALNQAGCATAELTTPAASNGPEAGETRAALTTPFDNVNDYNGFTIAGTALAPALAGYNATVTVAQQGLGGVPANEALLITVTVTGPASTAVTLHGYRVRYAPNALP